MVVGVAWALARLMLVTMLSSFQGLVSSLGKILRLLRLSGLIIRITNSGWLPVILTQTLRVLAGPASNGLATDTKSRVASLAIHIRHRFYRGARLLRPLLIQAARQRRKSLGPEDLSDSDHPWCRINDSE